MEIFWKKNRHPLRTVYKNEELKTLISWRDIFNIRMQQTPIDLPFQIRVTSTLNELFTVFYIQERYIFFMRLLNHYDVNIFWLIRFYFNLCYAFITAHNSIVAIICSNPRDANNRSRSIQYSNISLKQPGTFNNSIH